MTVKEFRLPDVGEGLTEAEIVAWRVKAGDEVKVNDVIVEIETAKSIVELPAPFAGVVSQLLVSEGDTVPVGTAIIAVDTGGAGAAPSLDQGAPRPIGSDTGAPDQEAETPSGAVQHAAKPRRGSRIGACGVRTARGSGDPSAAQGFGRSRGNACGRCCPGTRGANNSSPTRPGFADVRVLAKPPVRKLAKDLGIDLRTVAPSGAGGIVTRTDVESAAAAPAAAVAAPTGAGWTGLPREERVPIKGVRKATAAAMVRSAFTAPHVTEFLTVDVTRTMRLVDRLRASREFEGVKLSPLAVVAKALCVAAQRTPEVTSAWDEEAQEIVLRRYVNLGIAAATPRGLIVPNVKDAHELSLRDLAVAINDLAATARAGKTQPAETAGGTISITNVGVFGVDTGTPILNPGEAAILAFGAVREQPWVHKGRIKKRWVTTLGLSFDHRLVDGQQGSRFLADIGALLEDPSLGLVWA